MVTMMDREKILEDIKKERPLLLSDVLTAGMYEEETVYKKLILLSHDTGFSLTTLRNWAAARFTPRINAFEMEYLLHFLGVPFPLFMEGLRGTHQLFK